jgi:hypothetical protein
VIEIVDFALMILHRDCSSTIHLISSSRGGSSGVILYTLFMNKRAKKRLKEAIEKDRVERTMTRQEPSPSAPKDLRNPKGFLPKPAKKRG